jgi:hypothetical protein
MTYFVHWSKIELALVVELDKSDGMNKTQVLLRLLGFTNSFWRCVTDSLTLERMQASEWRMDSRRDLALTGRYPCAEKVSSAVMRGQSE